MATSTSKDQPAKKSDDEPKGQPAKSTRKADEASYTDRALALADDTRALAESIREDLDKLTERVRDLGDVETRPEDGPALAGVGRIPMAIDEVHRALQALTVTAADLSRQATV